MSLPGETEAGWADLVKRDVNPRVRRPLGIVHTSVGIELKEIPAGKFEMGASDAARGDDRSHPVTISKPFFFSVYEVTNQQWERVTGEQPPGAEESPYVPVTGVTWGQADGFCDILSRLPAERAAGRRYRLPTEAEWEYACRAGEKQAFCFGDNLVLLDDYAWHGGNARNQLHPVGFKKPNAWGLYDMHGNAAEWCQDFWAAYPRGAVQDPKGPVRGEKRVVRGGSWANLDVHDYESATRDKRPPNDLLDGILGFRIVMELGEPMPTSKK
jgi:formylglycine-generating enzyme required for sulfatase activity